MIRKLTMKFSFFKLAKLVVNYSFRAKLILGFLCIVILMGGISAFSYIMLKRSISHLDNMLETVIVANRLGKSALDISNNVHNYIFSGNMDEAKQQCVKSLDQCKNDLLLLKKYIKDEEGLSNLASAEGLLETLQESFNATFVAIQNKNTNDMLNAYDQTTKACKFISEETQKLILEELNYNSTVKAKLSREVNAVGLIVIFSLITIGIVTVFFAIIFSNKIAVGITNAVNQLKVSAQQVTGASSQLSESTQQLSQGSSEQASAIEETSSVLQESTSMLNQNSIKSKQTVQLSEKAKQSSENGNHQMNEMMASMQEIKKSSDKIAKIIKIIDDIAFQTNILALNAAIEAARAGEAGAGFAVVAEEVRNLAGRSAQAARDTALIIESNIELSGKGVTVAEKVQTALTEITVSAERVNQLMEEISAASQEQSQGVDQVTKAVTQMEKVTQQNAINAEESASISGDLNAQAENLEKIIQKLSQIINGAGAGATHKADKGSKYLINNL